MPGALGEPSAPVALVVSVMTVNIVTLRERDAGPQCCHHPMLGPILLPAQAMDPGPGGREQRNQLRTNKTGAQEEDFLKNCHDIFKIVNIYLSGTNLNICSSRRSRS